MYVFQGNRNVYISRSDCIFYQISIVKVYVFYYFNLIKITVKYSKAAQNFFLDGMLYKNYIM